MSQKVMVALSGGVDSAAAALLLLQQGYAVSAITMQIWGDGDTAGSSPAVDEARLVAGNLGIPHQVVDLRKVFRQQVVDSFCQQYLSGRTPNPCIVCNRILKFGALLDLAIAQGFDFLATGHYARIQPLPGLDEWGLFTALDPSKDQSYALYRLTQSQLRHALLPLGTYTKQEVRRLVAGAGLPVAARADSQDLCFVSDRRYGDFVDRHLHLAPRPGPFRDNQGLVVGTHQGIHHYTIGQRKGLRLPLGYPAYVTAIDTLANTVWVGTDPDLWQDVLYGEDVSYISGRPLPAPIRLAVKIRYSATPVAAMVTPLEGHRFRVDFDQPQRAITPGQAAVLYDGNLVIGGGTIATHPGNPYTST